jgi:molybdopterin-biosynthesis enzyme MoeA-like protein
MSGTTESNRRNARLPRSARIVAAAVDRHPGETLDESVARYQKAKADSEEIGAERESLKLRQDRGDLIKVDVARDRLEAVHLAWVAELEQMPHLVATGLPAEIPAAIREQVRAQAESIANAIRKRIGTGA